MLILETDEDGEIRKETTEEFDLTLKEFKAEIAAKYNVKGLISIYHGDRQLTDPWATLGNILRPNDMLGIFSDKSVAVAGGGVGFGGYATSTHGHLASAQGGFGEGGRYDGTTMRGGKGVGGDAKGGFGGAGGGLAGNASNPHGATKAGRGTGGEFVSTGNSSAAAKPATPATVKPTTIQPVAASSGFVGNNGNYYRY